MPLRRRQDRIPARMRKVVASAVVSLLVAGCAGEASGPESQPTDPASPSPEATTPLEPECPDLTGTPVARIVMLDNIFDPRCPTVSSDQTLEFVNEGKNRHTFTVADPKFQVEVLTGETKTTEQPIGEVLKPGTYDFICIYHTLRMKGDLTVV
jgi:plastocyanin